MSSHLLLPEERVRQRLLLHLDALHYPKALIACEKEISGLPNVEDGPKRRLDIIVYAKKEQQMLPLLVIECKAGNVSQSALEQVLGYNYVIQAPFVAVVGAHDALIAKQDGEPLAGIPTYDELLNLAVWN